MNPIACSNIIFDFEFTVALTYPCYSQFSPETQTDFQCCLH